MQNILNIFSASDYGRTLCVAYWEFSVCLKCCPQKKGTFEIHQVWNQHRRVGRTEVSLIFHSLSLECNPEKTELPV